MLNHQLVAWEGLRAFLWTLGDAGDVEYSAKFPTIIEDNSLSLFFDLSGTYTKMMMICQDNIDEVEVLR